MFLFSVSLLLVQEEPVPVVQEELGVDSRNWSGRSMILLNDARTLSSFFFVNMPPL